MVFPRLSQRDTSRARTADRRVPAVRKGEGTPRGDVDLTRKTGKYHLETL